MHALLFDWPYAGLVLAAALVAVLVREALRAGAPAWRTPGWVLGWVWPLLLGRPGDRPLATLDRA